MFNEYKYEARMLGEHGDGARMLSEHGRRQRYLVSMDIGTDAW